MADDSRLGVIRGWKPQVTFPDRLRIVRMQYGDRLGRRIDIRDMAKLVEVPMQTWAAWERGTNSPRNVAQLAKKVAEVTGGGRPMLDWLLGFDEFEPEPVPEEPTAQPSGRINRRSPSTRWYPAHLEALAA